MATTAIAAIGLGVSAVGSVLSYNAQAKAQQETLAASKKAENAREQQTQLDADRRRRAAVRESVLARATSMSVGTNQGAGGSSSLAGVTGSATGMGFENQQGSVSAEILGGRVFDANREYAMAAARGEAGSSFGRGLASLGGALVSNAGTINKLGQQFGR